MMDTSEFNETQHLGSTEASDVPLGMAIEQALNKYFTNLGSNNVANLHQIVMDEVEEALLRFIIKHKSVRNNQSRAAKILNISRTTLRKKLKDYDLL